MVLAINWYNPPPCFPKDPNPDYRGLILKRLDVVRMAVADAADRDPRDEVDVGVPIGVEDPAALAAGHREARVEREGLEAGRHVARLERGDRLRAFADLEAFLQGFGHRVTPVDEKRAASSPAMWVAATGRNRAKLGHALRSMTVKAPPSATIASPP